MIPNTGTDPVENWKYRGTCGIPWFSNTAKFLKKDRSELKCFGWNFFEKIWICHLNVHKKLSTKVLKISRNTFSTIYIRRFFLDLSFAGNLNLTSSGTSGICKKPRYSLRKMQYLHRYRIPFFPKIRTGIVTVSKNVYRNTVPQNFSIPLPKKRYTAQRYSVLPYLCRPLFLPQLRLRTLSKTTSEMGAADSPTQSSRVITKIKG